MYEFSSVEPDETLSPDGMAQEEGLRVVSMDLELLLLEVTRFGVLGVLSDSAGMLSASG
jgi:hypothetical protein